MKVSALDRRLRKVEGAMKPEVDDFGLRVLEALTESELTELDEMGARAQQRDPSFKNFSQLEGAEMERATAIFEAGAKRLEAEQP